MLYAESWLDHVMGGENLSIAEKYLCGKVLAPRKRAPISQARDYLACLAVGPFIHLTSEILLVLLDGGRAGF